MLVPYQVHPSSVKRLAHCDLHSLSQHIPLNLIHAVSISSKYNMKCQGLPLKFPKQFFLPPAHKHSISIEEKALSGTIYHEVGRLLKEKMKGKL